MRILLVMPGSLEDTWEQLSKLEPLGLETIAAYVSHCDVRIIDLRIEPDFENEMISFQPDVVGFHCHATETSNILHLAQKVKLISPKTLTVVGGHHPTLLPRDFDSDFIDVIVIGDGEITFKELVDGYQACSDFKNIEGIAYRKNGVLTFNRTRPLISNLDDVLLPNRELIRNYSEEYYYLMERPVAVVFTSRGCPHRCTFCSVWKFNRGQYRCMGPQRVVTELSNIGIENIFFADDNFLHSVKRSTEIYEAIQASGIKKNYRFVTRGDTIAKNPDLIEKWQKIGLSNVQIAFEYIRNRKLYEINKHNLVKNNEVARKVLQKNGVKITANFIIDPSFEKSDFDELLEYIEKMEIDFPLLSILTPLPGTVLYNERYSDLLTHNYKLYNFLHAVLPTKLPREEFYKRFAQLQKNSWLASMKRNKSSSGKVDSLLGYNIISALKKLSDHRTYISAEQNQISKN